MGALTIACYVLIFIKLKASGASFLSQAENAFLKVPSNDSARDHLKFIASEPHMAGTAGDLKMAEYVANQFRSFGIDANIEGFDALLTYPISRALQLETLEGSEALWKADLEEDQLSEDETSSTEWRRKSFFAYAPSGDVAAPLVYANYGSPEDFDALEKLGITVEGKVVIMRYGKCFRGLKVMNAQSHGAVGALVYSDPADDGFQVGPTYPAGPWRPEGGIQRGSSAFASLCGGDPARAAGPNTVEESCGYSQQEILPQIPAMPISYRDARPLLKSLEGPIVPEDFQGGLEFQYHTGPSSFSKVHVVTNNSFVTTTIWNVIAKIPGKLQGDEDRPVILGNHRDAWIFGAADPNSGTAVMLEVARGLGSLLSTGWRPIRSIYFGSWSGEEYNLIGSTYWGEKNADGLLKNAIAYLNVDTAVTGNAQMKVVATPSLSTAFLDTLRHIKDPIQGKSLLEVFAPQIGTPGSGTDYAVFLDHLGIASLDFAFEINPTHDYGVYHSIYDSFDWMEKWGDPTFQYHKTAAQLWGLFALRLADSKILPFDHIAESKTLGLHVDKIEKLDTYTAIVDLQPLRDAIAQYSSAAQKLVSLDQRFLLRGSHNEYNDKVSLAERQYLIEEGLPLRKWAKNVKQAPGIYLGYAAEEFPGIVHALRENDIELAQEQVQKAALCIQKVAIFLDASSSKSVTQA